MKKTQELTLKIEDLEERIAPHITVFVPDVAATDNPSTGTGAHIHATLGPNEDAMADAGKTWARPHF